MNRSVIADSALSAAKAYSHAEVEPRHVIFALARQLKEKPECAAYFEPAKRALEPYGHSYGAPPMSEAAKALLDSLATDDDCIAALKKAVEEGGSPSEPSAG